MEPMRPKLAALLKLSELPMATTPLPPKPGALKLGWFRMLKNSDRNCRLNRSLKWKFLKSDRVVQPVEVCSLARYGNTPDAALLVLPGDLD